MNNRVVRASSVRKSYGELEVVKGVDFEVAAGECFGILGPNGAGKTTLIKMMICFSPLGGGELEIFGEDVRTGGRSIKARLGVVPQEDDLDPDLTVRENLITFAGYFDIARRVAVQRADELIAFMQLESKVNETIMHLSGGLKRRLTIARALMNEPELVVLDEPTTGLDPQARITIWQKLRGLKEKGIGMILTTHYMDEAERLCDRIVVMDRGSILARGTPASLIKEHVGDEVLEYRHTELETPRFTGALRDRGLRCELAGDTTFVFVERADASAVMDSIAERPEIHRRATLEDVFLRLTGRDLRE